MPPSAAPHGATAPALPPPPATGKRHLLAAGKQPDLEPISYRLARQQQEPCEVVVLSLVSTRQARMPSMQLLGTKRAVFPRAPVPITTSAPPPSMAWTWPCSTCRQPAARPAAS
jgi:hypothetical protein